MPTWLAQLEKQLDSFAAQRKKGRDKKTGYMRFRLFLSSKPSSEIPVGLLWRSIKLTNQPPADLKNNLKRALCNFPKDEFDLMDTPQRGILFGLVYFHSVMVSRQQFGAVGFNAQYPFSMQDLQACASVLRNYLDRGAAGSTPWEDLRYVFGEIMYGGHITNSFDRILCMTYLDYYMNDRLLDELEMCPYMDTTRNAQRSTFKAPPPSNFDTYLQKIDELSDDLPGALGLHPNSQIDYSVALSKSLINSVNAIVNANMENDPGATSRQHVAERKLHDVLEALGEDDGRLVIGDWLVGLFAVCNCGKMYRH